MFWYIPGLLCLPQVFHKSTASFMSLGDLGRDSSRLALGARVLVAVGLRVREPLVENATRKSALCSMSLFLNGGSPSEATPTYTSFHIDPGHSSVTHSVPCVSLCLRSSIGDSPGKILGFMRSTHPTTHKCKVILFFYHLVTATLGV
jgi:hypothetical protein